MKLQKIKSDIINKKWGHEEIIHNDDGYSFKILHFKKGGRFSMHFHKRCETWRVVSGVLELIYIDTDNANKYIIGLYTGDIIHIPELVPHQLIAHEDSQVYETSPFYYNWDNFRVEKGDSQK